MLNMCSWREGEREEERGQEGEGRNMERERIIYVLWHLFLAEYFLLDITVHVCYSSILDITVPFCYSVRQTNVFTQPA